MLTLLVAEGVRNAVLVLRGLDGRVLRSVACGVFTRLSLVDVNGRLCCGSVRMLVGAKASNSGLAITIFQGILVFGLGFSDPIPYTRTYDNRLMCAAVLASHFWPCLLLSSEAAGRLEYK